jgi:hypothetical protein
VLGWATLQFVLNLGFPIWSFGSTKFRSFAIVPVAESAARSVVTLATVADFMRFALLSNHTGGAMLGLCQAATTLKTARIPLGRFSHMTCCRMPPSEMTVCERNQRKWAHA